jgi:hypothetical protein
MNKKYKYTYMLKEINFYEENKINLLLNTIEHYVMYLSRLEKQCKDNEDIIKEECKKYIDFKENIIFLPKEDCEEIAKSTQEKKDRSDIEIKLFNKLFKIIAIKCHPDKCNDELKNKLFVYANETKNDDDIIQLLFLFLQAKLEHKLNLDEDEYNYIQNKIEKLEDDIDKIKGTIIYKWKTLSDTHKNTYLSVLKSNM